MYDDVNKCANGPKSLGIDSGCVIRNFRSVIGNETHKRDHSVEASSRCWSFHSFILKNIFV